MMRGRQATDGGKLVDRLEKGNIMKNEIIKLLTRNFEFYVKIAGWRRKIILLMSTK